MPPTNRSPRLAALDGVRGFALLGMLAWHAEVAWVKGGFARMTVFFVLSGYLAANSYRKQIARGEPNAMANYWVRRVRRLMPVTLLGVALAILVTALVGDASSRAGVTWDSIATLTSWINWRFVAMDRPYAAIFELPSAFQHFWTLAVEEQAFLLTPSIVIVATWFARRSAETDESLVGRNAWTVHGRRIGLRAAAAVAASGAAASLLPLIWKQSIDTVYYGTHVRIGEFLMGVALAFALPLGASVSVYTTAALRIIGPVSLLTLTAVMLLIPRDQAWLYRGGMGLMAVPAVGLIAAVVTHDPATTTILSTPPFRLLGRWALSVYAVHWPLFVLLRGDWFPLDGIALQLFELSTGVAAGALVFRYVESPLLAASAALRNRSSGDASARPATPVGAERSRPGPGVSAGLGTAQGGPSARNPRHIGKTAGVTISQATAMASTGKQGDGDGDGDERHSAQAQEIPRITREIPSPRQVARGWRRLWDNRAASLRLIALGGAALVIASLAVPPAPIEDDLQAMAAQQQADAERVEAGGSANQDREDAVVMAIFGGSSGLAYSFSLANFAAAEPGVEAGQSMALLGCGLMTEGERLDRSDLALMTGQPARPPEECLDWRVRWPALVVGGGTTTTLLVASTWDLEAWVFAGDDTLRYPGDPVFDENLRTALIEAIELLHGAGADTVILTTPMRANPGWDGDLRTEWERRLDVYESIVSEVAADRDYVALLDLRKWSTEIPDEEFLDAFPDALHPTPEAAETITRESIGPTWLELSAQVRVRTAQSGAAALPDAASSDIKDPADTAASAGTPSDAVSPMSMVPPVIKVDQEAAQTESRGELEAAAQASWMTAGRVQ